jgi:hypothetical protein
LSSSTAAFGRDDVDRFTGFFADGRAFFADVDVDADATLRVEPVVLTAALPVFLAEGLTLALDAGFGGFACSAAFFAVDFALRLATGLALLAGLALLVEVAFLVARVDAADVGLVTDFLVFVSTLRFVDVFFCGAFFDAAAFVCFVLDEEVLAFFAVVFDFPVFAFTIYTCAPPFQPA